MSDIPKHIGFIVDGNRRWARERGLEPYEGHFAGYDKIKEVLVETLHKGVEYASCYIFSTENWSRPQIEIDKIMDILVAALTDDLHYFNEENVRLRIIGGRDKLQPKLLELIDKAEESTANNTAGELLICLNYGGQQEIVDAVKNIINRGISVEAVTPELIEQNLYAPEVPACDLIVRTSGEQRLSNFMLWRSAYSELLFIDKNWPDMTKEDVSDILDKYSERKRRFGK